VIDLGVEKGRAFLLCGMTGSGKTTYARGLERAGAIVFSADEWMLRLYGEHMARELFDSRLAICYTLMLELGSKLLSRGLSVAFDGGFWTRESRDRMRHALEPHAVSLLYFATPRGLAKERLRVRNRARLPHTFEISDAMFDEFEGRFEAPTADERPLRIEPESTQILFLCTGNYYRSRFAEELFNHLAQELGLVYRAQSAGLAHDCPSRNVGPLSRHTIAALAERGIPLPAELRLPRDVNEADLENAALVIALKDSEHRPMVEASFPAFLERVEFWEVNDVPESPPSVALPQIERHVRELIARLSAPGSPA